MFHVQKSHEILYHKFLKTLIHNNSESVLIGTSCDCTGMHTHRLQKDVLSLIKLLQK
jgi:hypothetical protein